MKKFVLIIICMVLLVSCGNNAVDEPADEPEITTPEVTTTTPATTTPVITTTTPAVTTTTAPKPEVDFDERLAALEPRAQREANITARWYNYTTYELIPRADYGKLYPFRTSKTELYGLMTADGKIVVDPAYEETEFIGWNKGYYLLHQTGADYNRSVTLIRADGSRIIGTYDIIHYSGNGQAVVRNYKWESGGDQPDVDEVGFMDLEGMFIIPMKNRLDNYRTFTPYEISSGREAVYINIHTGETFGGDYEIYSFKFDPNEAAWWGLKDVVVRYSPQTDMWGDYWHSILINDKIIISTSQEERTSTFADKKGNVLMTLNGGWFRINGRFIQTNDCYFDFDLNEVKGVTYIYRLGISEIYVLEKENGERIVRSYQSGKEFALDSGGESVSASNIDYVEPERFIHKGVLYDMDGNRKRLFSSEYSVEVVSGEYIILRSSPWKYGVYTIDGEELLPIEYESITPLGDGLFSVMTDGYTGVINRDNEWVLRIDMLWLND